MFSQNKMEIPEVGFLVLPKFANNSRLAGNPRVANNSRIRNVFFSQKKVQDSKVANFQLIAS